MAFPLTTRRDNAAANSGLHPYAAGVHDVTFGNAFVVRQVEHQVKIAEKQDSRSTLKEKQSDEESGRYEQV